MQLGKALYAKVCATAVLIQVKTTSNGTSVYRLSLQDEIFLPSFTSLNRDHLLENLLVTSMLIIFQLAALPPSRILQTL